MEHVPVMVAEVLAALAPERGTFFIDATTGAGGHAAAIMERAGGQARLLALDRNRATLERAAGRLAPFGSRVTLARGNFRALDTLVDPGVAGRVDGILFDLGLSRFLLEESGGGFSFRRDEPLDMRFDPGEAVPDAARILATADERSLADIFYHYGEIRRSRALAARIVATRKTAPLTTSGALADLARRVIRRHGAADPATRVFQALRIAVNDELAALGEALPAAFGLLAPGGRLVVIAYHSLEDRIVKRFFRGEPRLVALHGKPRRPSAAEIAVNRAARSAKLRAGSRQTGTGPAPAEAT